MNKLLFGLAGVALLAGAASLLVSSGRDDAPTVASFAECVAAGNPVMESYPRQCRAESGELFVEEIDGDASEPQDGAEDVPPEDSGATPPGALSLDVGEEGAAGSLSLTLDAVVADNRCPVDAECIEGGAITARVTLAFGGEEETVQIASDEVPYQFHDALISIIDVLPELYAGEDIPADAYSVTFRVIAADGENEELVTWEAFTRALRQGSAETVVQLHSLEVRMHLSDGRVLVTQEPEIDAVFREIEACGEPCANIAVATE